MADAKKAKLVRIYSAVTPELFQIAQLPAEADKKQVEFYTMMKTLAGLLDHLKT